MLVVGFCSHFCSQPYPDWQPVVLQTQTRLQATGRLEATADLLDVAAFDIKPLPMTVLFWRRRSDDRGRVTNKVLHRCPLLAAPFLDPMLVLALDTLHTLHLGVVMRFVAVVFWRVVSAQPWGTMTRTLCAESES